MGKKNKEKNLGRLLVKSRFANFRCHKNDGQSYLHTEDLKDGYDWGLLNLQSVTEENSFQEFLTTAELAGTEFQAEKLNIHFINSKSQIGILSAEKSKEIVKLQEKNKEFLKIPRRPKWNKSTSPQELQTKEREEFLEWRRKLALLQETEDLILTPYEKNLQFWRQLWRVIERSDIVVQIVDARNPLLFRCEDLEQYVKEVSQSKINMILINKADFLTEVQRKTWAQYFSENKIRVAFFSALLTAQNEVILENDVQEKNSRDKSYSEAATTLDNIEKLKLSEINNSSDLLTREELILFFKNMYSRSDSQSVTTVGLVGYPNVGKSSTINALLMDKKVSVSTTPGKTKHFQTIYLTEDLLLCDCPGLVMPSFVSTKAEMILHGILPINQMKDHVPSMNLLGTLIPRHVLESLYGIMIPLPIEGEDPDRSPSSEEILDVYAFNRGFMTQNGQPDNARAARYILKDFVTGKLLYCKAPPHCNQDEFHTFPISKGRCQTDNNVGSKPMKTILKPIKPTIQDLDKMFFQNNITTVHSKGKNNATLQIRSNSSSQVGSTVSSDCLEKPWKNINKHCNKKKREKTRRVYAHLDQH